MKRPTPRPSTLNPRWYLSALALVDLFYWAFYLFYKEWWFNLPQDKGPLPWATPLTNLTLLAIFVAVWAMSRSQRLEQSASSLRRVILLAALLFFFYSHVQIWHQYRKSAGWLVEDVGKTTIAADKLLLHGKNPYTAPIDPNPSPYPRLQFDGYKYLPLTMAAYLPAAVYFQSGDQGIVTSNLIFSLFAAAALAVCLWRAISPDAAFLGLTLFFMPPVISYEELVFGANDIVPMVLLFWALCLLERRFICGLLIGLAISAKFLPGVLWIPLLLTPRRHKPYFCGIAAGLCSCLPLLLWNPQAMFSNTILFILNRPWQHVAPLYGAPRVVHALADLAVIAIFISIARRASKISLSPIQRCNLAALLTIALQLVSPTLRRNYFIWWFLPFCVTYTAFIFNPATYEWMAG